MFSEENLLRATISTNLFILVKFELNIIFSEMMRQKPDWVYANILYRITPLYSIDRVIQLMTIVLDKTKREGSTTLFIVDPATLTPQNLAMIENLFDSSVDTT